MAMQYYSTNRRAPEVSFREALLGGQAPDRGLYLPVSIPKVSADELMSLQGLAYHQRAFEVLRRCLTGDDVPADVLAELTEDAYNFPVPLEQVYGRTYVMRLDQGPTASFKDFAARMMARLMNYYLAQERRKLVVLTATSGDTGGAIANAFFGLENIEVVILFPREEVTAIQRRQMTTLGGNVRAISLEGKFDDCQALVKQAFWDEDFSSFGLTSANSINIGRLLPQMVYYFHAWAELASSPEDKAVFSIPSGNFGNMMGAVLAKRMGLPISKVVAATNENDEFPVFYRTGGYEKIVPSINCISSAMNVGHPSNLARLVDLYGGSMDEQGRLHMQPDLDALRRDIYAVEISDAQTRETMRTAWQRHQLLLEPHGAVGWLGLQQYAEEHPGEGRLQTVLETAHPAKFPEHIREVLGIEAEAPESMQGLEEAEETYDSMEPDYSAFKAYLKRNV